MHASGKILCGIGLVLVLIGGGMFAWGALTVSDSAEDLVENEFVLEGVTSGTVEIVDDDGNGELGFTIYIEGTHADDNDDGTWDTCEGLDINVTHTDDSENSFDFQCDAEWDYQENRTVGNKHLIRVGHAAEGYENGTASVSCSAPCWVQYDDKAIADAFEDLGGIFGGALAAMGSTCFFALGCCFLVFGLIFGLTISDKSQTTVIIQGGGGGQMVGTPMAAPGGAVPMAGAPIAAPVAAPDPAQEYYSGLIAQGYDAQSASQYTSQHYPGFQG